MVELEKPFLSILMPVYNAQKYLRDTIQSILMQSYRNFELILIDDGSSDGSGSICDEIAGEDSRVRVIHQENHGLCNARNTAVQNARGEYIIFSDHDDLFLKGAFDVLANTMVTYGADLVKGTYLGEILSTDGSTRVYDAVMPDAVMKISELAGMHYKEFNYVIRAMWNGIYKTALIREHGIKFDENLKAGAEDYDFNLQYLEHAETIGLISRPIYKHFARENQSASVGYNENRQKGIIKDYQKEADLLKRFDLSAEVYIRHQLWYYYMLVHEYSFKDTPLSTAEIISRLDAYAAGMDLFRTVSLREKVKLFRKMPKMMIQWMILCSHHTGILYRYNKLQH